MDRITDDVTTEQLPATWSDDMYVYILESSDRMTASLGALGDTTEMFSSTYLRYTREEWDKHVLEQQSTKALEQLSNDLETVRKNRIQESRDLLEEYYSAHPILSSVHGDKAYYSVTSEKQDKLAAMIGLCDKAREGGIEFTPVWNATGEVNEEWTEEQLVQLSIEIAKYVYPFVAKQQEYEKAISESDSVQEIKSLDITY